MRNLVPNGGWEDLRRSLEKCWSADTSANPNQWMPASPAVGQCAVTALIVQDLYGGDLLRSDVGGSSHYWNRIPSGEEIDLTRDQFGDAVVIPEGSPRDRAYVLSFTKTRRRYALLRERILARLTGREMSLDWDLDAADAGRNSPEPRLPR